MKIEDFLSRLKKVKKTGHGTWTACCPAHDDKNPSMSIRQTDERILMRCHAFACGVDDIAAAVGMTVSDFFPEKPLGTYIKAQPRPFPAADVLAALAHESLVVAIIASDMRQKRDVSDEDYKRLWQAHQRIEEASRLVNG